MAKKRRRQTSWILSPSVKEKRFPLADEGKGPFNSFSLRGGCCQTRWGSLRCLPPATSRNKWSKPVPFQANFFPVRLEPAGRRGVVSPERSSSWLGAGGSCVFSKDNFLVSVLTSTHTQEGTEVVSEGAPGRRTSAPGSRRGTEGSERSCGGRGQEGASGCAWGGGVLGLSLPPPYFRHLTPSAKRAVPPRRRRWRRRLVPAGPGDSALAGRAPGPPPPAARREAAAAAARVPDRRARPARPAPHPTRSLPSAGARPPPRAAAVAAPLSGHARTLRTSHAVTGSPPPASLRASRSLRVAAPGATAVLPLSPPPPLRLVYTPDSGRGLAVSP